jgi:hypothetical protein
MLEHNKEADRIVYEDFDPDCGFILLPPKVGLSVQF